MTWLQQAACTDVDPDLFFDSDYERAAKAVCATCPVREACLEFSLSVAEYGIFGGENEKARRKERRKRGIVREKAVDAKCGTASGARRHNREGEPSCDACASAQREYHRGRRAASRERAEAVAS